MPARDRLLLASSNAGKLREFRALSAGCKFAIEQVPGFLEFPKFSEDAPTFAQNAAGKALHYSRFAEDVVFADDSGLAVAALGGAPGVRSARYAGTDASDAERVAKLLGEMRGKTGSDRTARFICIIAAAHRGRMLAVISDSAEGVIAEAPRGRAGFGYDPIFYSPALGRTFAELSGEEKNEVSHRGKAFRKLLENMSSGYAPGIR